MSKKKVFELKNKVGRPTMFTKKMGLEICGRLALGESLLTICEDERMPNQSTVYLWLLDSDKKEFSENYARARASQAEVMFDDLLKIADESNELIRKGAEKKSSAYSQNQRLRVDTRKWYLSKVLPKKFGDKLDVTSDGKPIPLLHVLHNNKHGKDTQSPKKD